MFERQANALRGSMNAIHQERTPIVLVAKEPPSAEAIDEDVYLSVPVSVPSAARTETIDIFLSIDFARRIIAELQQAIEAATRNGR
jgi:hypothetical protein